MEYQGVCDIGLHRKINQDAIFMETRDDVGLFCVADGMGGHENGELASQEIIFCLALWWRKFQEADYDFDFLRMMDSLHQILNQANQNIYQMTQEGKISGSTVVSLFIYRDLYGVLCAGDSRIYMCDKMKISRLTRDDTWENQSDLHLSSREKRRCSDYGKLVNAVGIHENVRITSSTNQMENGVVFMLCSDGLYKMCSEHFIASVLRKSRSESLEDIRDRLMAKVYKHGARDNVSVILVKT